MINIDAYGKTPRELLMTIADNEKKKKKAAWSDTKRAGSGIIGIRSLNPTL